LKKQPAAHVAIHEQVREESSEIYSWQGVQKMISRDLFFSPVGAFLKDETIFLRRFATQEKSFEKKPNWTHSRRSIGKIE
jgi:hypothetical protein